MIDKTLLCFHLHPSENILKLFIASETSAASAGCAVAI